MSIRGRSLHRVNPLAVGSCASQRPFFFGPTADGVTVSPLFTTTYDRLCKIGWVRENCGPSSYRPRLTTDTFSVQCTHHTYWTRRQGFELRSEWERIRPGAHSWRYVASEGLPSSNGPDGRAADSFGKQFTSDIEPVNPDYRLDTGYVRLGTNRSPPTMSADVACKAQTRSRPHPRQLVSVLVAGLLN